MGASCCHEASADPQPVGEEPCVYNASLPSGGGLIHSNGADSVAFPACRLTYVLMSLLFAVTTPLGVGIGLAFARPTTRTRPQRWVCRAHSSR